MGISPVQRLVAPRVVAALVVGELLTVVVAMTAMTTGYIMNVGGGSISSGAYLGSFVSFGQPMDFFLAEFKALLFGFIATIVACAQGTARHGRPEGRRRRGQPGRGPLRHPAGRGQRRDHPGLRDGLPAEGRMSAPEQPTAPRRRDAVVRGSTADERPRPGRRLRHLRVRRVGSIPVDAHALPPRGAAPAQADIAWGSGALVVGGGTIGVMVLLALSAGTSLGIEGFNGLEIVGLAPLTGFISASSTPASWLRSSRRSRSPPRWAAGSPPSSAR